jgi:predicted permease
VPGILRTVINRCTSFFGRQRLDADLDEELRTHIELATEENLAQGMNAQQARRAALRRFGGVAQTRENYRVQRGLPWLETLFQDVRYALRQLRKSPGFAVTAILTLALGVGSVTAVFSVVNAVLLRPYAFRDPGQIVVWRESIRELQNIAPVLPDNYRHYLNLKAHANTVQDAAIVQTEGFSVSTGIDHPQMTEGLSISSNFFSVLGVEPLLGRAFTAEEGQMGRDKEIILTWGAWQRLFHGDSSVLGKTLRVGSDLRTVVGIMPRSFRFPVMSVMPGQATHGSTERYEMFKPLVPMADELTANDAEFNYVVIARLKPGLSIQQAQSELDGIEKATAEADHLTIHLSVIVEPFAQEISGDFRKPLWLLFAAVASVLLMACVNLANLQIARGVARDQETALRSALGAGRARLLQGVLVENLLIGLVGGLAGIAFAFVAERTFVLIAATLPRLNEVRLSLPMLGFSLALSVVTSLAFGILPALRALRIMPQNALQSGTKRISSNKHTIRSRRLLVAVEVACSVTLLVVTALITRSFSHLLTQDRQFDAQHVLLAKADLSASRYAKSSVTGTASAPREAMIDRTLEKLSSLPGVQSAAVVNLLPMTGEASVQFLERPDHPLPTGQAPMANLRIISPGYFDVMNIQLIAGRGFSLQDRVNQRQGLAKTGVTILSDKAAKAAFPGEDAIGRTITLWGEVHTIVGISADARTNDLKHNSALFYLPYWDGPPSMPVFLVRSSQSVQSLQTAMRPAIWSIDPDISIPTVTSLDEQVDESVATERFQAILLSSFGAGALLLAVLGIYGVLAYSVSLRTQEFGIRIALGSSRASLARLMVMDVSVPVLGGIVLGLAGAAIAAKWVSSLLYETSTVDPWSIGLSLAVLLAAAGCASLLPVCKAAFADPMRALRAE